MTIKNPILVFGFERSGTTLLSMVLGAHPDIALPYSVTGLWYKYQKRLGEYGDLQDESNMHKLIHDILDEERISLWDVDIESSEIHSHLKANSFDEVIRVFHELYAIKKGKKAWANIDIATLDDMDIANSWFPDAKFIHIVRDGRDVALSHMSMPYGASNILECAETWKSRLNTNLKMAAMLTPDRYFLLKYEDLILKSEPTLRCMCKFLDVEYSEKMLGYYNMVDEKIPDSKRWLWPDIDKPFNKDNAYKWQKKMSKLQCIIFERHADEMLEMLGYKLSGYVKKSIAAYLLEFYYYIGKEGRMRRLKKKFGIKSHTSLEARK